jgi:hypothetical protein
MDTFPVRCVVSYLWKVTVTFNTHVGFVCTRGITVANHLSVVPEVVIVLHL